jgi:hypothetical protein
LREKVLLYLPKSLRISLKGIGSSLTGYEFGETEPLDDAVAGMLDVTLLTSELADYIGDYQQ